MLQSGLSWVDDYVIQQTKGALTADDMSHITSIKVDILKYVTSGALDSKVFALYRKYKKIKLNS
jgi:hypothetical protein